MSAVCRALIACAVVAAVQPSRVAAQIELTPTLGMYIPVGLLVEGTDVTDNSFVRRRQIGALLIGGRIGVRPTHTFGLEGSVSFSPSMVAITDRSATVDIDGKVLMAGVRGIARVRGQFARGQWAFYVAPGFGVVQRMGSAWSGTDGTTDGAVVLSAGARLGRLLSSKAFRFDVENYITRADFDHSTTRSEPRIHHDMIWSFGLSLPVAR